MEPIICQKKLDIIKLSIKTWANEETLVSFTNKAIELRTQQKLESPDQP